MTSPQQLDELFTYLRFPSVSTDSKRASDVRACAEFLTAKFRDIGLDSELHETAGNPVVIARSQCNPRRRTVLIYGHYDVQPADPIEEWNSHPFEPVVIDDVIYARGSTDNKGQNYAHILGVQQLLEQDGELPVNLIFLIEGEEEIGSPNLEPFLSRHREALRCDVVTVSDTGMVGPGVPTLSYGLRGIACLEFRVTGPKVDLHSGIYGGAVANPAMAAAQLVAGLQDAASGRVLVEGFYDKVRPLQDWEAGRWANLPDGDAELLEQTGVPEVYGEHGFSSYQRRWSRPTIDVNGIGAGYQDEGSKTVIAKQAMVKLSCRLVPDQEPGEILDLVSRHLERNCANSVRIEIDRGHSGAAYLMDPFTDYGKAAQQALRLTFDAEPMLIREGGSIPIMQSFRDILGVDTLMLGLALPDSMAHAPNENFPVANFEAGIRLNHHLLKELGRLP